MVHDFADLVDRSGGSPQGIREAAILHRARNPDHRLIFVCNTPEEVLLLQKFEEAAFFYNKTANSSERIFRPLERASIEFDAIYNAQLIPWKRHELSLGIESCAFLFYRDSLLRDVASSEAAIMDRHAAAAPGHVFLNALDGAGVPIRLPLSEVNRHLNRASIGLCLSEREGAMFASTEYLLSGLPIVSTPSTGGRHVYYDEEYCCTVPPDPRSVRAGSRRPQGQRDSPLIHSPTNLAASGPGSRPSPGAYQFNPRGVRLGQATCNAMAFHKAGHDGVASV